MILTMTKFLKKSSLHVIITPWVVTPLSATFWSHWRWRKSMCYHNSSPARWFPSIWRLLWRSAPPRNICFASVAQNVCQIDLRTEWSKRSIRRRSRHWYRWIAIWWRHTNTQCCHIQNRGEGGKKRGLGRWAMRTCTKWDGGMGWHIHLGHWHLVHCASRYWRFFGMPVPLCNQQPKKKRHTYHRQIVIALKRGLGKGWQRMMRPQTLRGKSEQISWGTFLRLKQEDVVR